jgi:hypothetical protein
MAGDIPLAAASVGALDGVDAEGQVVAAMEDPRRDDALLERVGGVGAVAQAVTAWGAF